jgi:hypothetical protein
MSYSDLVTILASIVTLAAGVGGAVLYIAKNVKPIDDEAKAKELKVRVIALTTAIVLVIMIVAFAVTRTPITVHGQTTVDLGFLAAPKATATNTALATTTDTPTATATIIPTATFAPPSHNGTYTFNQEIMCTDNNYFKAVITTAKADSTLGNLVATFQFTNRTANAQRASIVGDGQAFGGIQFDSYIGTGFWADGSSIYTTYTSAPLVQSGQSIVATITFPFTPKTGDTHSLQFTMHLNAGIGSADYGPLKLMF